MLFPFSQHTSQDDGDLRARFQAMQTPHLSREAKEHMQYALQEELSRVTQPGGVRYNKRQSLSFIFQTKPMIPILAAIVILLGGTFGTAAAADSAKPGDALFGIDQAVEKTSMFFALSGETKARIKTEIAEERENERAELETEGRADDALTAEEHADVALVNAIETISDVRVKMEEKGNDRALEALSDVESRLEALRQLRDDRDEDGDDLNDENARGLTEAEVHIENGVAEVQVEFNDEKTTFALQTSDRDAIITEIVGRTGATEEEVRSVVRFEENGVSDDSTADDSADDESDDADTEESNDDVNDDSQSDTNTNEQEQEQEQEQEHVNGNTNQNQEQEQDREEEHTNTNVNSNQNRSTNTSDEEEQGDNEQNQEQVRNEIRVEVNREDGKAEIRTRVRSTEMEWELNTTSQNTILLSISAKTGLSSAEIQSVWEYRVED